MPLKLVNKACGDARPTVGVLGFIHVNPRNLRFKFLELTGETPVPLLSHYTVATASFLLPKSERMAEPTALNPLRMPTSRTSPKPQARARSVS